MQHGGLAHIPIRNPTVILTHRTLMPNKTPFPSKIPTSKEDTTPISKATITPTEARKATPNIIHGKATSIIIQANTADGQLETSGFTKSIVNSKKNS